MKHMTMLTVSAVSALGAVALLLGTGCEEEVWIDPDIGPSTNRTSLTILALGGKFLGAVNNDCGSPLSVEFPALQSDSPKSKLKNYAFGNTNEGTCDLEFKMNPNKGTVDVGSNDFRVQDTEEGWYDGTARKIKVKITRDGEIETRTITEFELKGVTYRK